MSPRLHILVGPTGAGKTTFARALAEGRRALIFSIDEWMGALYGPDLSPADGFAAIAMRAARVRGQMARVAAQGLAAGCDGIFDTGLLTRAQRREAVETAQALGAPFTVHCLDASAADRWARIDRRNSERGPTFAFPVTRAMFDLVETLWQPPDADELAQPFYAVSTRSPTASAPGATTRA